MPRNKNRKAKFKGSHTNGGDNKARNEPSDEDYDTGDTWSVTSGISEASSCVLDSGGNEVDDSASVERLENKLKDCIEAMTEKSAQTRLDALHSFQAALRKHYLIDFLLERKFTVSDNLERCLKKGKAKESAAAAMCLALFAIQLGCECHDLYEQQNNALLLSLKDGPAKPSAAAAIGILAFIACADVFGRKEVMKSLELSFASSYIPTSACSPAHILPATAELHVNALRSWCLLLSICPPSMINEIVNDKLPRMVSMLRSLNLEIRMVAGQAVALMYELQRASYEDFMLNNEEDLLDMLKMLSLDHAKSQAKKDRRTQRSCFREVLHCVEDGSVPAMHIKFGKEELILDCWSKQVQYHSLCQVLSSGLNLHLKENRLVREVFDLGTPILDGIVKKISKLQRTHYNAAIFKA